MQFWLFPSESPIPQDARPVPNFGDDYLITPDGDVWSNKWLGPRKMRTFEGDGGPRVCLWRYNRRYCPDVETLRRQTFGVEKAPTGDAQLIRDVLEEYGNSAEVLEWAASL